MAAFEYDEHQVWEPLISDWMREIAPAHAMQEASQRHEYIQDARDIFLDAIGKRTLADFLAEKLASRAVKVFHGTRVSESVLMAIRREGLKPLNLMDRKASLAAELQDHPRWGEQQHHLEAALHKYGPGWERGGAGRREDGGVHVCLSRSGLLKGSNHYLTHGAEVDNHITRRLFEDFSEVLGGSRIRRVPSFQDIHPGAELGSFSVHEPGGHHRFGDFQEFLSRPAEFLQAVRDLNRVGTENCRQLRPLFIFRTSFVVEKMNIAKLAH